MTATGASREHRQTRPVDRPGSPVTSARRDEAAVEVVVDHPGRLHERVHRRRADEPEAAPLQLLRERRRLGRRRREIAHPGRPTRPRRRREPPDEVGQAAGKLERGDGIPDRRLDLAAMADDRRVGEQPLHVALVEPGDALDREAGERLPEALALAQDRQPREPGLEPLEREELEQGVVAPLLAAPLVVVVGAVERIVAAPAAASDPVRRR